MLQRYVATDSSSSEHLISSPSLAFSELLCCSKAHRSVKIPWIANKNAWLVVSLRGHAKVLRKADGSLAHYDVSVPMVTHNAGEVKPTI